MNNPFKQREFDAQVSGMEQELKALKKLAKVNKSQEFDDYFELLLDITAKKMFMAFTGDNVKSWEDFLKVRAEVTANLYPIQEVRSAEATHDKLKEQLEQFYGRES